MSGHGDPSRTCTRDLPHAEVADTVNLIANCGLTEDWQFGMEPYSRANPRQWYVTSLFFFIFSGRLWPLLFISLICLGQNPLIQPVSGVVGPPRQFASDRAESDVNDPDLGAAALEADAEGGGEGEEGDPKPSATFADWPVDEEGEVAHQPRQDGPKKRRAGPSSLGGREKRLKGAVAATKREEAAAKAQRFRKEVKKPPLSSA